MKFKEFLNECESRVERLYEAPDFSKAIKAAMNAGITPRNIDAFIEELRTTIASKDNFFKPKNRDELMRIVDRTIKVEGHDCDLNFIDTSLITDMSNLFAGLRHFNGDISGWDVSNVTNMSAMFHSAESFNRPLDKWDTSKVTNMHYMFNGASSFNQPIGNWDVSKVEDMGFMFSRAKSFNKPLDRWNPSNVTNMRGIFDGSPLEKNPPKWFK